MPKMNTKPAPIQEQGAGLSVLSAAERVPTLSAERITFRAISPAAMFGEKPMSMC